MRTLDNAVFNKVNAVNWNKIEDEKDLEVWNRLTSNFWLPEAIAVSNDLPSWGKMTVAEQALTRKVFAGLTMLDTMQSAGAADIMAHALTPHEEAVMSNLVFMEAVHAKSYSNIFSTLCGTAEINEIFDWALEDPSLQFKGQIIQHFYDDGDPLKMRIASVMLESFLFYSGFYWPFYLSAHGKLTNSADIIRLIVRDEGIHGYYIGYKFQKAVESSTEAEKAELKDFTYELLQSLYENEVTYTQNLYDDVGLTEDAMNFVRYNANKALMNLGYDAIFSGEQTKVNPLILASLATDSENHDFFSGSGSSYVIGQVEALDDDDFDF